MKKRKGASLAPFFYMETYFFKTNMLAIIFCGLTMAFLGFFVFFFKDSVAPNIRYFLPIPPVGVAAYIFVFNMFRKYNGQFPTSLFKVASEISIATIISAAFFLVFSIVLTIFILLVNNK
ncbi:MAG: hypothetical protein HN580_21665 [Deltaproteobacteria bacterium]|nr:hypothetical protein [Deltaproteobacteria bacterium]MBT4089520.1 hypothetical protein [Deltaproteobacteria bacterium]MBT4264462.1 hypothetical protein [Deltaproteobacteria bacterium]MBT4643579.1 hypothetical protein [Deltaproteobacteria bacterium]MBT6501100.1 hypothetical protein [Deltaproteobacteria bacterium]